MKKLFVLISVLFLIGSVSFAQTEKTVKTEKKAKIESAEKKDVKSKDVKSKDIKAKPIENQVKPKAADKNIKQVPTEKDVKPIEEKPENTVKASDDAENQSGAEITFKETSHDFGNIPFKGNGSYEFVFVNTGTEPLILTQPKSSCGCTVPEWPRQPILPGESNVIKVTYKNTDRPGNFNKYVTVFSNAAVNKEVKLHIKGTVEPEPTDAAPLNNGGIESPVKNN